MSYTNHIILPLAAVLAFYLICVSLPGFLRRRRFIRHHGCRPTPNANRLYPVLGLDQFIRLGKAAAEQRYLEHWEKDMFGRYGNTFDINLMGQSLLFANEPQNIQAMLVTKFPDFEIGQRRRDNSAQLLGVGLFNADGPVADLQLFEKHFRVWMDALPKDGELVDLQEWAFRYTLDVGTEFLLDKSVGVLHPEATALGQKISWAFNVGVDGVSKRIRLGKLAPLYHNPDYNKACKVVHDYVDPIVKAALEKANKRMFENGGKKDADEERYTFLNALASEGLSQKKIRDHVLNILIAARDTSACLMSAVFFELARQPEAHAKLRDEINTQLHKRFPTYDDLKDMKYLNYFLKETLRLYHPIPLNIRVANKDTVLPVGGGPRGKAPVFVCKGQEVVYQIFSTHQRRDLWGDDANEFRPERWETARPHFQYLPFNAGQGSWVKLTREGQS
ncbi:hypothetical protein DL767_008075 [Monosporascus sp. MG133]|nr:hypothetical protein DL767_008075 [Monosporascus sp. MG133]